MRDSHTLSPFIVSRPISRRQQYWLSSAVVCLVSVLCFLLSGQIVPQTVAFILLLTVSVLALFFTILPVLLAAVLSAGIWDFFFLQPRYNFRVGNTEDKILLSMYFVIALVNAVLTYKIRQVEKVARRKEEKTRTLKLYNTLLNSLSHELRTPIATIIGATDNLLEQPSRLSAGDSRKLLSEIAVASLRLNRQVDNLLNMSRLESGYIQPKKDWCNIHELVCSIIKNLEEQLVRHRVEICVREGLPLVRMDYGLMEQAIGNLVYNATLYTPEGSLIRIGADCPGGEGDGSVLIFVEDNGPGFPEEEIGKVFEKFYRLNDAGIRGSGLGLSIVKGFVEAHNGTVTLTNRGGGAGGAGGTREVGGARFEISVATEKFYLN